MEHIKIKSLYPLSDEEKRVIAKRYFKAESSVCLCKYFGIFLKSDGSAEMIGSFEEIENFKEFQAGEWQNIIRLYAGYGHIVGLKSDGTVVACGDNCVGQCNVEEWQNITDIKTEAVLTIGLTNHDKYVLAGDFKNLCITMTGIHQNEDISDEIKHKLENVSDRNRNLKQKIDTLTKELKEVCTVHLNLQQTLKMLEIELNEERKLKNRLEKDILNREKQKKDSMQIIEELQIQLTDYEHETDKLKSEIAKLEEKKMQLSLQKEKRDKLEKELSDFRETLLERQRTLDTLKEQNARLEQELKEKENAKQKSVPSENKTQAYVGSVVELERKDFIYLADEISVTVKKYNGSYSLVSIPDRVDNKPVERIGEWAFSLSKNLTTVVLPNTLKHISSNAFNGCKSLKNITIPNNVEWISGYAFYGCRGLSSIFISENIRYIGKYAFSGCSMLFKIYGKAGSYAEQYAKENHIAFVAIS